MPAPRVQYREAEGIQTNTTMKTAFAICLGVDAAVALLIFVLNHQLLS